MEKRCGIQLIVLCEGCGIPLIFPNRESENKLVVSEALRCMNCQAIMKIPIELKKYILNS